MKRSTQLLLIFAELRRALGDAIPAGDALDFAERLAAIANYRELIDRCGTADFATPGCVPVDRAFDDGGWALLHEVHASGLLGDDDYSDYSWLRGRQVTSLTEQWA